MNLPGILALSLLFGLCGYLLYLGKSILMPFVLAIFIWHLINAMSDMIVRYLPNSAARLPRVALVLLSMTILFGLLWGVAGIAIDNAGALARDVPGYVEEMKGPFQRLLERLPFDPMESMSLEDLLGGVEIGSLLSGMFSSLVALIGNIGAIFLYVVFLLLEQHSFPLKLDALFSDPARREKVRNVLAAIEKQIRAYLWLKTLTSSLTAIASFVIMVVVGLEYADMWAILIFILNFIPYLGSLIGVAVPALFGIVQFHQILPVLVLVAGLSAVQVAVGNFLEPRLLGKGLNISPLVMLLGLAVWGSLWGGAGMFLSVPLLVITMIVLSCIPVTRPVAVLMSQDGRLRD